MTVSELITKLQACPQDAIVLTDNNNEMCVMGEALNVSLGVGYKIINENGGRDYWVGQMPWRYSKVILETGCVYVGSGQSIIDVMWERK